MKRFLLLAIFLFSIPVFSQRINDTIVSVKLDDLRPITISLPPSYGKKAKQTYPLLVLLDGEYLLDPFEGALKYGYYWEDLPEIVVVSINQNMNKERIDDSAWDPETGLPYEKGEKFFEFVGQELIPYIEKQYRIAPYKIICGHDLTAGFANFFLYKERSIFDAYIVLSPELALDMEDHIADRLNQLPQHIDYYFSMSDGDVPAMKERMHDLNTKVSAIKKPSLNYEFEEFKNTTHYSFVLNSIPSALYNFFAVFKPITKEEFDTKIAVMNSGFVTYLTRKYDFLKNSFGIKMPIRINDFNAIEAAILKNKAYNELGPLSDLARKDYPTYMLADYQLALMYEKNGDKVKAAKSYMNAFQKTEIGNLTKDMMLEKAEKMKNITYKKEEKPAANTATPEGTLAPEGTPAPDQQAPQGTDATTPVQGGSEVKKP